MRGWPAGYPILPMHFLLPLAVPSNSFLCFLFRLLLLFSGSIALAFAEEASWLVGWLVGRKLK